MTVSYLTEDEVARLGFGRESRELRPLSPILRAHDEQCPFLAKNQIAHHRVAVAHSRVLRTRNCGGAELFTKQTTQVVEGQVLHAQFSTLVRAHGIVCTRRAPLRPRAIAILRTFRAVSVIPEGLREPADTLRGSFAISQRQVQLSRSRNALIPGSPSSGRPAATARASLSAHGMRSAASAPGRIASSSAMISCTRARSAGSDTRRYCRNVIARGKRTVSADVLNDGVTENCIIERRHGLPPW